MENAAGFFIINKSNKILLGHPTKHKSTFWGVPKGRLNNNETPLEAAIRETFEESNIKIEENFNFTEFEPEVYKNKKKRLYPFILFEIDNNIDFSGLEIKCNSSFEYKGKIFPEMDNFDWFKIDDAINMVHESQVRVLIKIKNRFYGK